MIGKQISGNIKKAVTTNIVPVVFTLLCLAGAIVAEASPFFLLSSVIIRLARNLLLVFSLIIPVVTGLGLNFGIVLGAMAAQIALIAVTHWNITGLSGFVVAALLSVPISILFGWLTGKVLNQAKGNEMITSMMLGFFANGLYQLLFLFVLGGIIPMVNKTIMLPSGIGIKNTVSLRGIKYALDNVIKIGYDTLNIPILTFIVITLLALVIKFLLQTKLGQELRCVGQDINIAATSGIDVDKMRITAVIMSTVLAAWGQLIHLQNIGILQTYGSHEQVGLFAVASILIGGATVTKATIGQAVLGTFLFHLLFIISPMAGQKLVGEPQVGEYFRAFVAYGVIGVSLGLHAWQKQQAKKNELEG